MAHIPRSLRVYSRACAQFRFANKEISRSHSSNTVIPEVLQTPVQHQVSERQAKNGLSPLKRLPTSTLLRSLMLDLFFRSPMLIRYGLAFMKRVANSRSFILNPDKNILLRRVIRPLIYDQFCAGANKREVEKTITDIKRMGYSGVILSYSKEIVANTTSVQEAISQKVQSTTMSHIQQWRESNLQTLKMMGEGDYLALKFTGAGSTVTKALADGADPPQEFLDSIDAICQQAASQNSLVWVDAEQQVFQPTIDTWAIGMMRRYNRNGEILVLNTIQAYLKSSRENLSAQLRLAQAEGWGLGIKLVRGAYIGSDPRNLIHDTKADTDDCFNSIVRNLLSKSFPGFHEEDFPDVRLFIASHNADSVRMASELENDLTSSGKLKQPISFGMLQGMADDVGCELLEENDCAKQSSLHPLGNEAIQMKAHKVYKYLAWGTVQECMQYLVRRAVENQGATDKLKGNGSGMRDELFRRVRGVFSTRLD